MGGCGLVAHNRDEQDRNHSNHHTSISEGKPTQSNSQMGSAESQQPTQTNSQRELLEGRRAASRGLILGLSTSDP